MLSQQQVNDLNTYIGTTLQPQLLQMGLMFQGIEQHPDQNMVCFQFNLPPIGLLVVNTQGTAVARASLDQIGQVILQTLKTEQERVRAGGGMPQAGQTAPPAPNPNRPRLNFGQRPTGAPPVPPRPVAPVTPVEPTPEIDKQQATVDLMIHKFEVLLERAAEGT